MSFQAKRLFVNEFRSQTHKLLSSKVPSADFSATVGHRIICANSRSKAEFLAIRNKIREVRGESTWASGEQMHFGLGLSLVERLVRDLPGDFLKFVDSL